MKKKKKFGVEPWGSKWEASATARSCIASSSPADGAICRAGFEVEGEC